MSIFGQSTPVDFTPELDTVEETAELESHEEQYEEPEIEEQPEEQADSEPEQSEELIAGKFKTQEDMVKAYKNLERQFHDSRQKPAAQTPAPQSYDGDPNEAILDALNRDPIGTLNYFVQQGVQQALAPLQEERSTDRLTANIDKVAQDYKQVYTEGGMTELFAKIGEIAQEFGNPSMVNSPTPRVLRMAAEELWGKQSMSQVYQQALQQGRQQAEESRRAKAGLSAPGNAKPKETPKSEADHIADSIVNAGRRGGLFGR